MVLGSTATTRKQKKIQTYQTIYTIRENPSLTVRQTYFKAVTLKPGGTIRPTNYIVKGVQQLFASKVISRKGNSNCPVNSIVLSLLMH